MLSLHNIHFVLEDVISHVQHENVIQRFITGCFHLFSPVNYDDCSD